MYIISIWIGKCIQLASRLAGNSGASLPGYVIERINSRFLARAMETLPLGVVIITGTNGKTTTTKLIADSLQLEGVNVLTNKSGSNFVRGIISLVVQESSWTGKLHKDIAILEQDEAYAVQFVKQFKPRGVVLLNIMRDQMDRFGEIDTTAKLLQQTAAQATGFVVLNQHDDRIRSIRVPKNVRTITFGLESSMEKLFPNDDSLYDAANTHRPRSTARPDVRMDALEGQTATYSIAGKQYRSTLSVPGPHNAFNAAAAIATLHELLPEVGSDSIIQNVSKVESAFGRGEIIEIDGRHIRLQLVKNPSGFRQSLSLLEQDTYAAALLVINDDYADGRDMSWLWDVPFDTLQDQRVLVGGTRAYDMAVRLKYDGIRIRKSSIETDLLPSLKQLLKAVPEGESGILFCTYTAMWRLRKILTKLGHTEYVR